MEMLLFANQHRGNDSFISKNSTYSIPEIKKLYITTLENILECETKLRAVFLQEYAKLEKFSYDEIINEPQRVSDEIKKLYPELFIEMTVVRKFMQNQVTPNKKPSIIDVLTLGQLIKIISLNWESKFSRRFRRNENITIEALSLIGKVRNEIAHNNTENVGEDRMKTANKYCVEIINLFP